MIRRYRNLPLSSYGWDEEWAQMLGQVISRGLSVADQLAGLIPGDTKEIIVLPFVPLLRSGVQRSISAGWLSIKDDQTDSDATENAAWTAAGCRQKITTTNNVGIGQILNAVSAELRFDITAANSVGLTARRIYYFDVQILCNDNSLYTVEAGSFKTGQQITIATS